MNSSRHYLEAELRDFANALKPNSRVLDAGAGDCRYRELFQSHRYESTDYAQGDKAYGRLDYRCDLRKIPVGDALYDAIICTQVLAHIPEPALALKDMARTLREGGKLLLTAPLFFQENEKPFDFFRFTEFGLRHLMDDAGLIIERIDWLEGYCGTLAYQLGVAARMLRPRPADFGGGPLGLLLAGLTVAARPGFAVLAWLLDRADRAYKHTGIGQCKNYLLIASKVQDETENR